MCAAGWPVLVVRGVRRGGTQAVKRCAEARRKVEKNAGRSAQIVVLVASRARRPRRRRTLDGWVVCLFSVMWCVLEWKGEVHFNQRCVWCDVHVIRIVPHLHRSNSPALPAATASIIAAVAH